MYVVCVTLIQRRVNQSRSPDANAMPTAALSRPTSGRQGRQACHWLRRVFGWDTSRLETRQVPAAGCVARLGFSMSEGQSRQVGMTVHAVVEEVWASSVKGASSAPIRAVLDLTGPELSVEFEQPLGRSVHPFAPGPVERTLGPTQSAPPERDGEPGSGTTPTAELQKAIDGALLILAPVAAEVRASVFAEPLRDVLYGRTSSTRGPR